MLTGIVPVLAAVVIGLGIQARRQTVLIRLARRSVGSAANLAETAARLEATLAHMSDGVALFTPDRKLGLCNRKFGEILDLPAHLQQPGTAAADLVKFSLKRGDLRVGDRDTAIRSEADLWDHRGVVEFVIPAGRVVQLQMSALPDGGRVFTYSDITLPKRVAETMGAAKEAAEAAARAKSDFLAHMSHELRTPLNTVIGFTDLMMNETFGPLAARYRDYVDIIHRSGAHLLELINEILDLSKIEAGKLELEQEPLDLLPLLEECIAMMAPRAEQGGLALFLRAAPDMPWVDADRRRLQEVMLNLLSNAVKFTRPGGKITVGFHATPAAGAVIEVVDTGVGIAAEDLPRVMEKWGQARADHSHAGLEGSGLGLPLSKRLVEMHGGRLTLESALGIGTRITLWFPPDCVIVRPPAASVPATGRRASF